MFQAWIQANRPIAIPILILIALLFIFLLVLIVRIIVTPNWWCRRRGLDKIPKKSPTSNRQTASLPQPVRHIPVTRLDLDELSSAKPITIPPPTPLGPSHSRRTSHHAKIHSWDESESSDGSGFRLAAEVRQLPRSLQSG